MGRCFSLSLSTKLTVFEVESEVAGLHLFHKNNAPLAVSCFWGNLAACSPLRSLRPRVTQVSLRCGTGTCSEIHLFPCCASCEALSVSPTVGFASLELRSSCFASPVPFGSPPYPPACRTGSSVSAEIRPCSFFCPHWSG